MHKQAVNAKTCQSGTLRGEKSKHACSKAITMWMSDETISAGCKIQTQRKAIQSDTFSHIVYRWKANWGSCIVFYFPNFASFAFFRVFFFYCDVSFEAVLRYPLRMCLAGVKQSIPCVPDTPHLHNTDRNTFIGYKCIIQAHFLCRGLWAKSRHWLGQHSRYTQTGTAETGIFHFAWQLVWNDS